MNIHLCIHVFLYLAETKSDTNRTECIPGQDCSVLVYKIKPGAYAKDTVRKIAIEREGNAKVEVQVWKTVEGTKY